MEAGTEDLKKSSGQSVTNPSKGGMAALRGQDSRRDAQGEVSEHAAGSAGCSQLEGGIPALASCFPKGCTPDPHATRGGGGAGPKSKHILTSRGRNEGKQKAGLSQQIPPSLSTSPSPCHGVG